MQTRSQKKNAITNNRLGDKKRVEKQPSLRRSTRKQKTVQQLTKAVNNMDISNDGSLGISFIFFLSDSTLRNKF